ncbi:MAG: helix-turn-helix transcriptional regulator [Oscillospiraceae bacterium]|nr:helix-turn-helix transcriptional regulator [Oscillospiraceae bacterium]
MIIDKKTVGNTIRALRISRGLTQEVLSGLAGIARTHLTMIENGSKQANFETLCKIAAALGLRPSELVKHMEENRLEG